MEFRFRAGERRKLSIPYSEASFAAAAAAEGYFTAQALRAGLLGGGVDFGRTNFLPPISPLASSLQREILKERIRERILREMEQRRILEDEVRMELEIERRMGMRMAPPPGSVREQMKRTPEFMLTKRKDRRPNLMRHFSEGPLDEVPPRSIPATTKGEKKTPLSSQQKLEGKNTDTSPPSELQVQPSKQKPLGTKRKAEASPESSRRTIQKEWSCALCHVNATSEQSLNDHLEGKKHKAKIAALSTSNAVSKGNGSNAKSRAKSEPTSAPHKIVNIQVDGKMHRVHQKNNFLWCECCKLKCNSTMVMASHLGGKRHNAKLMESQKAHQSVQGTVPSWDQQVGGNDSMQESASKVQVEEDGEVNEKKEELCEPNNTEV